MGSKIGHSFGFKCTNNCNLQHFYLLDFAFHLDFHCFRVAVRRWWEKTSNIPSWQRGSIVQFHNKTGFTTEIIKKCMCTVI